MLLQKKRTREGKKKEEAQCTQYIYNGITKIKSNSIYECFSVAVLVPCNLFLVKWHSHDGNWRGRGRREIYQIQSRFQRLLNLIQIGFVISINRYKSIQERQTCLCPVRTFFIFYRSLNWRP